MLPTLLLPIELIDRIEASCAGRSASVPFRILETDRALRSSSSRTARLDRDSLTTACGKKLSTEDVAAYALVSFKWHTQRRIELDGIDFG